MKGFISYAHADYDAFKTFCTAVAPAARHTGVSFWSDSRLHTGQDWNQAIADAIAAADVFVALVSLASLGSPYINDHELPAMKARCAVTGGLILPVVLNRCLWRYQFSAIQVAPTNCGSVLPVDKWRPQRDGFVAAAEQVFGAIERYYELPAGATP
jgi:hypothetical protein